MNASYLSRLFAVLLLALSGRQQSPTPAPGRILGSGAMAIVVDAVVLDAKGNLVSGLQKEDFRLFEDGVQQDIGDLTFVGTPGPTASGARVPAGKTGAKSGVAEERVRHSSVRPPGPAFVAIVFDRLSHEARALAYKGALACVDTLDAGDYAGVFIADLSLTTIQDYTNDRQKLRVAVKEAASRATSRFDDMTSPGGASGSAHPAVPVVASAESVGRPVDMRNTPGGESAAIPATRRMTWEMLERQEQGYATTNALLALAAGLARAPGRKNLIFFAEGLAIPDAVLPRFRDVVTTANRGNVSVYTIDAAGLRVHSKDAETGRAVRGMGTAGLILNPDGTSRSSLAMMEYNEDVLRKDPRTSLTLLAEQTGGFLVENTNDLAKGVARIQTDRRSYYLLTYAPKNASFDGKWRTVDVKVPGRQVTVRARSGYVALRGPVDLPVLAHEGPALAALEATVPRHDLPLRSTVLVFPERSGSRVAVLASTEAPALRFDVDDKMNMYRTDATILARVVDDHAEAIRKSSQRYRLTGPVQQLDQARRGEILFFRQPSLGPGRYTLEVAVHDALSGGSAVRRTPFIVPAARPDTLQVSSLVVVQRAERVGPEERQKENPLYVGDLVVYPNMGEPIRKTLQKTLPFYIVVQPGSEPGPTATVEIIKDGQTMAQASARLGSADVSGRIQHLAQIPIETLLPGLYTLRMTLTQGDRREVRESSFTLIE
jgi:VWFA-related protein